MTACRTVTSLPLLCASVALVLTLSGCGGTVREHIRARDFRSVQASAEPQAAASPIANVPDMPGWTTDLGGAQEFAKENGRRTVVLVVEPGHPASERAKQVLSSEALEGALGQDMRVLVDLKRSGMEAGRLNVSDAPALVILDSAGNATVRRVGPLSQKIALGALKE